MDLSQLENARNLALGEGKYYSTILPGVLPIISTAATSGNLEIQRWGAEFLAEAFAAPTWSSHDKEVIVPTVVPVLRDLVNAEDTGVIKSTLQTAASVYPLVYRHIITHPQDTHIWQGMLNIKSNILRRMDAAPSGVRICCVKFVQQVVLVQTPGMVADPRRPEQNDISLALMPRDHPLITYTNLEAEASGLLDRLLDIIHGDHSDALLVTATLNSLGMLVQRRPIVANKILNSILNFNALKLANSPMTPKNKVIMRSIERTTRALLVNVMKRHPDGPFNGRIQQYLERMHRMRLDVFDESNRKRPAPTEPTDGLDATKRQRLGANPPGPTTSAIPQLPPGPVSYRQLYTLDPDGNTANFDVQAFKDPEQLLKIVLLVLHSIDATKLSNAINVVRSRYLTISKDATRLGPPPITTAPAVAEDDEEYEPDFEPEDAVQMTTRLDGAPPYDLVQGRSVIQDAPLAPYKLPDAPPLNGQEAQRYGDLTVRRMFGMVSAAVETSSKAKNTKVGFSRLAANSHDRDSWVTVVTRLATRASIGLEDPNNGIKSEFGNELSKKRSLSLSDSIRDALYNYIIYDWRKRIDVAINWLNEEWYNDRIQSEAIRSAKEIMNGNSASLPDPPGNYHRCLLRVLDGILPYIEGTDKGLLRLMSEIPEADRDILQRMKKMAEDPDRIDLSIKVLQYLYLFKPPSRVICADVLEDMWRTNDRAKPLATKLLSKWRPEILNHETEVKNEPASTNGALEVKAN